MPFYDATDDGFGDAEFQPGNLVLLQCEPQQRWTVVEVIKRWGFDGTTFSYLLRSSDMFGCKRERVACLSEIVLGADEPEVVLAGEG